MTSPSAADRRISSRTRKTAETDITATVEIDGTGASSISTGVVFLDHMLTSFSRHSGINVNIECKGDLDVDDHHSVEDVALVLGGAISDALGDKKGIGRYGWAIIPMDEALAQCSIDLGGRSYCVFKADFARPVIQGLSTEMVEHFFVSLSRTMNANIHLAVLEGKNTHHMIEALFKSLAYAMKQAVQMEGGDIRSTKGVI
ncbi:MAG: imidazoleglycerol-phosphate dehydratase HisB [Chlorobiaceae bacterium]|nr:imidazoleglycerol-phosphate dehydratase HisB [Chlorobiaceae bacterium]